MAKTQDRTLTAAGMIFTYAVLITYADNYVRVIAAEAGLWQFHATRSVVALGLLAVLAVPLRLRLRPVSMPGVMGRSAIHGLAMLIYFGCLAFLPVAQVVAGLFSAPIFVLLISRFAYGHKIGPVRILAVGIGFVGVILVLGPAAMGQASIAAILPVLAGALYALGNVATREWCAEESAETLLAGFFVVLGVFGTVGILALAVMPVAVDAGADGFIQRGWVWPSRVFYLWVVVQAVLSLIGVGLMIKAYQLAEASRVSVFEYIILPVAAIWGWLIWAEVPSAQAVLGMALIAVAGAMIALRARQNPTS